MAVDSIEGHWAIIGKDSGAPTGQRFNVRQEPVELDPAELGIAERYLGQAIKSVRGYPFNRTRWSWFATGGWLEGVPGWVGVHG